MGCVKTITYNTFPKQKGKDYRFPGMAVGAKVKVCFHYDTNHCVRGRIVRDDLEEPFETIIRLDDGRYVRGTECQFSYALRGNEGDTDRELRKENPHGNNWEQEAKKQCAAAGELRIILAERLEAIRTSIRDTRRMFDAEEDPDTAIRLQLKGTLLQREADWLESVLSKKGA